MQSTTNPTLNANHDSNEHQATTYIETEYMSFPSELLKRKQWLVWAKETREGDTTKIPYKPSSPRVPTGTASPSDWTDYSTAQQARDNNEHIDGIGFVFTDNDPYVGIDLDYILNDGLVEDWAIDIIEQASSYTELSPSGEGAHIIARGSLDDDYKQRDDERGIEMYEDSRFFTMTGRVLVNAEDDIKERESEIQSIQTEYLDERDTSDTSVDFDSWDKSEATRSPDSDEEDMIDFMKNVNDKFKRLHEGSSTGYKSESEADQAYFQQLAWLTANDPALMEKLARSSERVRPKWDESRGSTTWLRRDIREAIRQTSSTCNKFQ